MWQLKVYRIYTFNKFSFDKSFEVNYFIVKPPKYYISNKLNIDDIKNLNF